MKIGMRGHDFGRMSVEELPTAIESAGFETTQLAMTKALKEVESFADIDERLLKKVYNSFSKSKVDVSVLGCYIEPAHQDKEQRLQFVDIFCRHLAYAKELDIPVVGTETTRFVKGMDREEAYQRVKDSVLRMVEAAEKNDVLIGIEPVADHSLCDGEWTRRLLDEVKSKKLKIIMDPINLVLPDTVRKQEEIYRDFLRLLGKDIVALHIKDVAVEDGKKVWRRLGEGIGEFAEVFSFMKKNHPFVPVLREQIRRDSVAHDLRTMQDWANDAGELEE